MRRCRACCAPCARVFRVSAIAEEDPNRVEMLSRARGLGSREARYLLGKYYMRCTDPGRKAPTHPQRCIPVVIALKLSVARLAQAKAYPYFTRIAEPNAEQDEWATKAMYQLGLCHLYGIHAQADPSLAFCYFCNAADRYVACARALVSACADGRLSLRERNRGHARAQNMTGSFYDGQISPTMPRDVELALEYYQKSAAQGCRPAQYNLATLLLSDHARDEPKVALLSLLSTPPGHQATSHNSTRGDGITHVRVVGGRHLRCSRNWPRAERRRAC